MTVSAQATENQPQVSQPDEKQANFDKLRKQLDQERAEKSKLMERVSLLEKAQPQKSYTSSSDDDDDHSDEPYVDHRRLEKKFKKFESSMEEKIDKRAEEKARTMLEQEKQHSYMKQNSDFQQVLTPENIEKFANQHPAIAERMLRMPDNFDRQALLYEQIKALQTKQQESQKPSIQDTINQNRKNPSYQPTGMGASPYAPSGDFSAAGQKNAYQKMQELKSKMRLG